MAPSATTTLEQHESIILNEEYLADDQYGQSLIGKPKGLIGNALKERIDHIDTDNCEAGEEDAFFVADMGEIYRQHLRWKQSLRRVKPHYGRLILYAPERSFINTAQPSSVIQI